MVRVSQQQQQQDSRTVCQPSGAAACGSTSRNRALPVRAFKNKSRLYGQPLSEVDELFNPFRREKRWLVIPVIKYTQTTFTSTFTKLLASTYIFKLYI